MKKTKITTTELAFFRTRFSNFSEYKERYQQIQGLLPEKVDSRFFASPRYISSKSTIDWFADAQGEKVVPLSKLNSAERNKVINQIKQNIKRITSFYREKYKDGDVKDIEKWFEIPSEEYIYVLKDTKGKLTPLLTMWGCVEDRVGSPSGVLKKLLPEEEHPVNIKLNVPAKFGKANGIEARVLIEGQTALSGKTNTNGVASFGKLPEGTPFAVEVDEYGIKESFTCDGRIMYELAIQANVNLVISVLDSNNNGIPKIPVSISFLDEPGEEIKQQTLETGQDGQASLEGSFFGEKIQVKYFYSEEWHTPKELVVEQHNESVTFIVNNEKQILILNKDRKPIEGLPLEFFLNQKKYNYTTTQDGWVPVEKLAVGDEFYIKAKYKKRRYKTRKVNVVEKKQLYEIILKQNRWFLLLWLLPLLVFFIPVKENIKLSIADAYDSLPVDSARISLSYFQTDDNETRKDTLSDTLGYAAFHLGWELLFSKLFIPYPQGQLNISKSCYADTTIYLSQLSKWKTARVTLEPASLANFDFVVKNKTTGHPVSEAKVRVKVEYHGQAIDDQELMTNFGGTVTLGEIPLCADIRLWASKTFHTPDSLGWVEVNQIARDLEDRVLYLESLLKERTFYVKSTDNRQGLPGALVEAHIESGNDVIDTIKTVASNEGEVSFPIPDTGTVFMKGTLLGYHDSTYLAKISAIRNATSEDEITLWMRPKTMPIALLVKDTTTGQPIANVQVGINCDNVLISSGTSNVKGEVFLGGVRMNCTLEIQTIHSNYQPKVISTSLSALLADSMQRAIYLRPLPPPGEDAKDCQPGSDSRHQQRKPQVEETYFMGQEKGSFKFRYNTYSASDKIEIFCNDQVIFSFEGATEKLLSLGQGDREEIVEFDDSYIKVVVTGSSAWNYTVYCPE